MKRELKNELKSFAAMVWLLLALVLGTTGLARAQDADAEAHDPEQDELEARLEEAQTRMEQAAREIAILSAQLVGDATTLALRSIFETEPRPMLGVNIGNSDDRGVPVLAVTPGGPADEAGLRAGDVLTRIDDVALGDDPEASGSKKLTDKMRSVSADQEVTLRYLRQGNEEEVMVTPRELDPGEIFLAMEESGDFDFDFEGLEDLEQLRHLESLSELKAMGPGPHRFILGGAGRWGDMELVTLTPDLGGYFGTDEGLLVVRAPTDEALKLKDGDVILDIGGRKPSSPGHAMRILRSYESGESLSLGVIREQRRIRLDIELPAGEDADPGITEPARFEREIEIGPAEEA
jgi:hypothetical protein